jgi:hypothetical protein
MYRWLIFLHVLGVCGLLLAHGASAGVAFKVRREKDIERIRVLLELSKGALGTMHTSLLIVLITGIAAGFLGDWWGHYWIWAALGVLLLISIFMTYLGTRSFAKIRLAVGPSHTQGKREPYAIQPIGEDALARAVRSSHPLLLTAIGGIGLAVILWLMMFKPF